MGAVCGRPDLFEDAGAGRTLGGAPSAPPARASAPKKVVPPVAAAGRTLGSSQASGAGDTSREEMARAAEARSASAKKRGAPTQGKLAMQLDQQSRDGGRVVDAVREGKGREEAIVFD